MRRDIVIQVPLAFVLDVEGEDVLGQILPFGTVGEEAVGVL
jgi:hypothetical protein